MEINWLDVLASVGITTGAGVIVVIVLGYLGQTLFGHLLEADLESYKAKLQEGVDAHKEQLKAELKRERATFEKGLESEAARAERVRTEVERWANPIIDSVKSLDSRLENILEKGGDIALKNSSTVKNPNWSLDYEYFLPSTVFLFAQFFCWQRLLEESLRFDLFRADEQKDKFLAAVRIVGDCLSSFPIEDIKRPGVLDILPSDKLDLLIEQFNKLPPGDRQVFHLQQRQIGETFISEKDIGLTRLRYTDFLVMWNDKALVGPFRPLRDFLDGVVPDTRRWTRLQITRLALAMLDQTCRRVLTA